MIEWKRPSGSTIETNDDKRNIAAAKKLGWKRVKKTQEKETPKDSGKDIQRSLMGNM